MSDSDPFFINLLAILNINVLVSRGPKIVNDVTPASGDESAWEVQ